MTIGQNCGHVVAGVKLYPVGVATVAAGPLSETATVGLDVLNVPLVTAGPL